MASKAVTEWCKTMARKRAASLTPERRKAIASAAGKAAWKGIATAERSAILKARRARQRPSASEKCA